LSRSIKTGRGISRLAISVLASVMWSLNNSEKGIIEPEFLDSDFVITYCEKWLGNFYDIDVSEQCKDFGDKFYDLAMLPSFMF
jgi:homospermidine synthase